MLHVCFVLAATPVEETFVSHSSSVAKLIIDIYTVRISDAGGIYTRFIDLKSSLCVSSREDSVNGCLEIAQSISTRKRNRWWKK